jgi:hypothetical protein
VAFRLCTLCVAVLTTTSFKGFTYSFADGHSLLGHGLGISHVVFHDGLEEFILIFPFERCLLDRREGETRIPACTFSPAVPNCRS